MAMLIVGGLFFGFVALVVVMRIVRRMARRQIDRPMNVDLSVADAHQMLLREHINTAEFDRLKEAIFQRDAERERAAMDARSKMPPVGVGGGHAFQVIQDPPPLPLASDAPPAGDDRDAR
jgi:hypothetical protein